MTAPTQDSAASVAILSALANTTATFGATTFDVVFDNAFADPLGIASSQPSCLADDADVTGVSQGSSLTVNATSYTVRELQPDGLGLTRLILEAA